MDTASLAKQLSLSRISFGAGLILAPGLYARFWVGPGASERWPRIMARSLGARELALGAGGLLALRADDRESARRWFAAGAATEVADVIVTLAGGGAPRTPARITGAVMAAGSAAVAAAYAAERT
jgi:hypothetical protein